MIRRSFIYSKHSITYYFTAAKEISSPLLFVFHGAGSNYNKAPTKFRDERLNVVALMDEFGYESKGSWYLGEKGDLFWFEVIKQLINELKHECKTDKVLFWGSSMGGYAALLHGYLNNVTAIYANVPQTNLLGTTYIRKGMVENVSMQKCIEYAFGEEIPIYNNLCTLIDNSNNTLIFLTYHQLEGFDYFNQQGLPFINKLHKIRQKYFLEVRPRANHAIIYNIPQSIDLMNQYIEIY